VFEFQNDITDKYSLRGRVFNKIREDILEGRYKSGDAIKETVVSNELGVSRTPVREAIRQLELEGLVNIIPNKGAIVSGVSSQDIRDIYTIRSQIEGLAAKWATKKISDENIMKLEEILELSEFYTEKHNIEQLKIADSNFHELIYEASDSKVLKHLLSDFHHHIQKARFLSIRTPGRAQKALNEHKAILEAIKNKDENLAEELMNNHVKNAGENVLKQFDEEI